MGLIGMHASQAHLQAGIRSTWVPVQHGIIDSIVVGRGCEMRDIGKLLHFVIPWLPSVALLGSSYDHGEIPHLDNMNM